ncbi:MAG: hypothetical protein ACRDBG_25260, partial [Waterburya sp.]
MISFHGKPEIKEFYLNRLRAHSEADEIEKGTYWERGKGCAVGCTIHSSSHEKYETELGIPIALARLEDRIFEGLPNPEAKNFPIEFLNAVPVGKDLDLVWYRFMYRILSDKNFGVIIFAKNSKDKVQKVIDLFEKKINESPVEKKYFIAAAAADAATATAAAAAYATAAYASAAYAAAAAYADSDSDSAATAAAATATAAAAAYATAAYASAAYAAAAAYADSD